MLAILGIGLGLLLGLACGGSLRALAAVSLRFEYIFIGLFVVQALLRGGRTSLSGSPLVLAWSVCVFAILVLASMQAQNTGLGLFALGTASNLCVVALNSGMPALASSAMPPDGVAAAVAATNGFYVLASEGTVAIWLADVVPALGGLVSVGDIMICVGVTVWLASSMHSDMTLVTKTWHR